MIRCVERCGDIVPMLSSWNVDGVFFAGASAEDIRAVHQSLKCPAVFIDSYCADEGVVCVGIDDYRGGYLSAQHLLNNGHPLSASASTTTAAAICRHSIFSTTDTAKSPLLRRSLARRA